MTSRLVSVIVSLESRDDDVKCVKRIITPFRNLVAWVCIILEIIINNNRYAQVKLFTWTGQLKDLHACAKLKTNMAA